MYKTLSLIPLAAAGSSVATLASPDARSAAKNEDVSTHYIPTFFSNNEWCFLLAATDCLIFTDESGPGVAMVFIDKQMELSYGYGHLWYMQPTFADVVPEWGISIVARSSRNLPPLDSYRKRPLSAIMAKGLR
ncbi:hypothetical protein [Sodalis-like endosymbiont of Proechinophthirus fluctus]|uniref:hypothetical protein n=1 Tax=Sodalis-like endosymbiont of Proechinophthirus fluctus TaxID=1462730 RepID=UPI001FCBD5CE|nr:hypothetical protein [Sodalis-like endosymbiont of Proechinophthirus fluctus]